MMSVNTALVSIGLIITISSFPLTSISLAQTTEFLTYKNSREDLSIQYPSNWTIVKKNPSNPFAVVSFRIPFENEPNLSHVSFGISIEKLYTNKISLADYIASRLTFKPSNCLDFRLLESKPSNLTGFYPAHEILYTCKIPNLNNMDFKSLERIMIKDKKAYVLGYTAETTTDPHYFNHYLPVAQKMFNSFEFTRSKN